MGFGLNFRRSADRDGKKSLLWIMKGCRSNREERRWQYHSGQQLWIFNPSWDRDAMLDVSLNNQHLNLGKNCPYLVSFPFSRMTTLGKCSVEKSQKSISFAAFPHPCFRRYREHSCSGFFSLFWQQMLFRTLEQKKVQQQNDNTDTPPDTRFARHPDTAPVLDVGASSTASPAHDAYLPFYFKP